jgi:hypothetical protein
LPGLFRRSGVWVLAFAVLIRAVFLAQIVHVPYFDVEAEAFDQINFHTGALALSHGDWRAPSANEAYSPLYKYVMGGIYALASPLTDLKIGVVRVLQLGLGVAVAWWVFCLGRLWGGTAAGVLASLLYSAFGQALFYESKILREFPATAAMMAALWVGRDGPSARGRWVASAVLMAVACQFRSNLELVALVFLGRAALSAPAWGSRLRRVGLWGAVFAVCLMPSMLRNVLVHGDAYPRKNMSPMLSPGRMGMFTMEPQAPVVLATTNHPSQDQPYCMHSGISPSVELQEYGNKVPATMGRTYGLVLRWFREDPAAFMRLELRKLYWALWDGEVPSNHAFMLWQDLAPVLSLPISHYAPFAALVLAGLAFAVPRRSVPPVLWLSLGAVMAGVCIAYPAGRVRAPSYPLLMLAAALCLQALWRQLRLRRILPVLLHLGVAAVLTAVLWPPEPAFIRRAFGMAGANPRAMLVRYIDMTNLGGMCVRQDSLEGFRQGEIWFRRGRNHAAAWGFQAVQSVDRILGQVAAGLCQKQLAADQFPAALESALRCERSDPLSANAQILMSTACHRLGLREAEELAIYRARLRDPRSVQLKDPAPSGTGSGPPVPAGLEEARAAALRGDARHALALLVRLAQEGSLAEARDFLLLGELMPPDETRWREWALLRALLKDPGSVEAHRRLVSLYQRQGMDQRALFHGVALVRSEGDSGPWHDWAGQLGMRLLQEPLPEVTPESWIRATRVAPAR